MKKLLGEKQFAEFQASVAQSTITKNWVRFKYNVEIGPYRHFYEARMHPCCDIASIIRVVERRQPEYIKLAGGG